MIAVSIDSKNLNTEKRRLKAQRVARDMKIIVNSPLFKKLILEMSDEWRQGSTGEIVNLTNEQIYNLIASGKEEWNGIIDNELDLIVDDYTKNWSSVVGFMNPGKPTIFVNTKFFDTMTEKRTGSNFLHEYGHTLGMRHGGKLFKSSIPYYLNWVYEKCYDALIAGIHEDKEPEGKWLCIPRWKFWKYAFTSRTRCRWVVA
jgi:hypothetical protein